MVERCRCGAELLPHVHFCVSCGADRATAGAAAGRPPSYPGPSAVPDTLVGPYASTVPGPPPYPPTAQQVPYAPTLQGPPPYPPPGALPPPMPPGYAAHDHRYPAAPRRSPAPALIAVAVVLVLLASAGAALVVLRPAFVFGEPEPVVSSAAAPAAGSAQPFMPSTTAAAPSSPTDQLRAQVDQDRSRVESVTGMWVPQLSSKRPGTVADGTTYDDASILAHYRGLASQYPGAALLWSGDWPVFKGSDYWVVIVAQPFSTAEQANAWCDAQGFGRDDCLAKTLSHSGSPAGTTVNR